MSMTRVMWVIVRLRPEVVLHVEHVGEERLGGLDLLHLVLHHDGLPRYPLSRAAHPQRPRDPLQEDCPHPRGHVVGVGEPVVVVEDHDGGHHGGGHHEVHGVEVRALGGNSIDF